MPTGNPADSLALAYGHALAVGLPAHKVTQPARQGVPERIYMRHPLPHEVDVVLFPQTWGSTALGFSGVGGQVMTDAYTVIVMHYHNACVYFNGRFAYLVRVDDTFMKDMASRNMADCYAAAKRYGKVLDYDEV